MKCEHLKKDGHPSVTLKDGEIRCTQCGEKIGIGENEIRSLIKLSTDLTDDELEIKFTSRNKYHYYYQNNIEGISTHEDVYIDGLITETSVGKVFSEFTFAMIIRKDNATNEVRKLIIVIKADYGKRDITSSPSIIKYLSPSILKLLL